MKPVKNLITIDGPSGVGKGTLAFSLAEKLGWNVLDSGLIYRLVGYITLEEELKTSNEITRFVNNSEIELLTNFKKRICPQTRFFEVAGPKIIPGAKNKPPGAQKRKKG